MLELICHRLSMQCRYGGDVTRFYSVAEHTVHMVQQADEEGQSTELQLLLWLHDAPEDRIGDLLPIIKKDPDIGPLVKEHEQNRMREICDSLDLRLRIGREAMINPQVKLFDLDITAAEAKVISNPQILPNGKPWAPYQRDNKRHRAFKARIVDHGPNEANFGFWAWSMVDEFKRILAIMS